MKLYRATALLFVFLIMLLLWMEWRSPVLSSLIQGRAVEILVLGIDEVEGTHRADSILLVRLEPWQGNVKVLQIPRDTVVRDSRGIRRRINTMFEREGPQAVARAVKRLLDPRRPYMPPSYVVVNFAQFQRLYSALGNVRVGNQSLDSDAALGFVRSRGLEGDLGRLSGQRGFYSAAMYQLQNEPWKLLALLGSWGTLRLALDTNLSLYDCASLIWRARSWVAPSAVYFFPLPGAPTTRGSFIADAKRTSRLNVWWEGQGVSLNVDPVRLEVLNAAGSPGLALRWMRYLRTWPEYDVIYFGNAPQLLDGTSVLVTRQADLNLAKQVLVHISNATGLALSHQVSPGVRRGVQFTLLLGQDSEGKTPGLNSGPLEHL